MDTKSVLFGAVAGLIIGDILTKGQVHEAIFVGVENLHQQVKEHTENISFDAAK